MLPRTIPRYVLKEFLSTSLGGMTVFTFVLLLERLFDVVSLLFSKGVSLFQFGSLLLFLIVPLFSLTVPMAFLLGALLAYGRFSEHGEVTALRASGWSFPSFLWPPLAVGILTASLMLPMNHSVIPRMQSSFRDLYEKVVQTKLLSALEPKTFLDVAPYRLYMQSVNKKTGALKGVIVYKQNRSGLPTQIQANTGTLKVSKKGEISLRLQKGTIQQQDPQNPRKLSYVRFKTYLVSLPMAGSDKVRTRSLRELPSAELRNRLKDYAAGNYFARETMKTELAKRTSLAFAPLAVLLIGLPLAITLERGGRGIGFGVSLLIIVLYYLLLVLGVTLSDKGQWNPALALWIPNLAVSGMGAWLFRRLLLK